MAVAEELLLLLALVLLAAPVAEEETEVIMREEEEEVEVAEVEAEATLETEMVDATVPSASSPLPQGMAWPLAWVASVGTLV